MGTRGGMPLCPGLLCGCSFGAAKQYGRVLLSVGTWQCSSSRAMPAQHPFHDQPVRSAFRIPAIGPTDRTPSPTARKAWLLSKLPILDSVSAHKPMRNAERENRRQPHDRLRRRRPKGALRGSHKPARHLNFLVKGAIVIVLVLSRLQRWSDLCRYWLFAPKEQPQTSPGQSEAAPADERRPGFRSTPSAGEPNGDHHSGTPTSLNPSAPRHARLAAASFTSRLHNSRLARPPAPDAGYPGRRCSAPG